LLKISNIMFFFAIIILTLLFWATSNVCKYNIALDKKTNQLNLLAQEIDPSIPNAKVYYFSELNCNNVDLSFDYERVLNNLEIISVMIYQELTTDLRGERN